MTKLPDISFFRNLVLHCLDYVPNMPEGTVMEHPDIKTLRSIQSAVNIIRSDYYSWFLALIWCIPEEDCKQYDRLANRHIRCLNLSDKNEELLLSCSILVQIAHFFVMRHKCLESVYNAARCLSKIFDEKYRERFNETDGWREFERYCETTTAQRESPPKADDTIDSVVRKEMTPWCKTENEKNILDFWEKKELKRLVQVAEEEKAALKTRAQKKQTLEECEKLIVIRAYNPMLKSRIDAYEHPMLETQLSDPGWKKCQTAETGFCLGCLLTVCYPEMKKETPRVKHNMFCQLWTEDGSGEEPQKLENAVPPRNKDLCATEIPRLPELVLNFVQKYLHIVFGTCVLKNVRNEFFDELDFELETCTLCKKQCSRKLVVCMDLYIEGCKRKL